MPCYKNKDVCANIQRCRKLVVLYACVFHELQLWQIYRDCRYFQTHCLNAQVRVIVRKLYLTSDSVNSTTLASASRRLVEWYGIHFANGVSKCIYLKKKTTTTRSYHHKGPMLRSWDVFLWYKPEQAVERAIDLPVIRDVLMLMGCQCNDYANALELCAVVFTHRKGVCHLR